MATPPELKRVSKTIWELPASYKRGMRVPARIYATAELLHSMDPTVFDQVTNVAMLPGITGHAMCMPDGHFGYGFPIGGVAAMDVDEGGVISPGGIGFDINCGMRLLRTNLTLRDVAPRIEQLVDRLFRRVPAGVGCHGFVKLDKAEFRRILAQGSGWCIRNGMGWEEDLDLTEESGCIEAADARAVSDRAIQRGYNQIGTLGSGNHYLEIQVIRPGSVFDEEKAHVFGLGIPEQIVVMFHCGSRGFGHQVATDSLQSFLGVMHRKYKIPIVDRELACAPFDSPEGRTYFAAMNCALNMSFANRQVILHRVREVFAEVFGRSPADLDMHMVYDVSHNTAKIENHEIDGRQRRLLVHRKGATRAFGPGMEGIPPRYRDVGQPVIIGGSMESGSYLLSGVASGASSFYSTAHGSGRTMSRARARKQWRGEALLRDMAARGILVRTSSKSGLAEEAGGAYKDIDRVVEATELAGLSKRVVRFSPVGNVKG